MASSSNIVVKAVEEESTPTPTSLLSPKRVYSCRHCSRQFSIKQALGGHQKAHAGEKHIRKPTKTPKSPGSSIFEPRPPISSAPILPSPQFGFRQNPFTPSLFGGLQSCGWDSQNGGGNKNELKETVFQAISHNGGGSKTELKESVIQPIAHSGPATIFGVPQSCGSKEAVFQTIAHNRLVTMFDGGEQYPYGLESGAQKDVGGLEGSCDSFGISFKKGGQMSFQSSRVTTVMSEEEEELDLSLHL